MKLLLEAPAAAWVLADALGIRTAGQLSFKISIKDVFCESEWGKLLESNFFLLKKIMNMLLVSRLTKILLKTYLKIEAMCNH